MAMWLKEKRKKKRHKNNFKKVIQTIDINFEKYDSNE